MKPAVKREVYSVHATRQMEGKEAVAREDAADGDDLQSKRNFIISSFQQVKVTVHQRRAP